MLDELLAAGEVTWSGQDRSAATTAGSPSTPRHGAVDVAAAAEIEFTDVHRSILDTLGSNGLAGGAYFFRQLAMAAAPIPNNSKRTLGTDLGRLGHR